MSAGAFTCEAYGPEIAEIGAVCFFSGDLGKRICSDQDECRWLMAAERRRVFRRMSELAASGDEAAAYLEQEFSSPDQILGGEDAGD